MSHQCPRKEFYDLLKQQNDEIQGSSLKIYSENNVISHIKNVIFTDWLRLKIYFHSRSKCSTCSQQK
jgi:hypothetical protein